MPRESVHGRERLSIVLDGAREAFIAMDQTGRITDWNRAAQELFGYTRDDAVGHLLAELIIPPALRAAHEHGLGRFLQTHEPRVVGRRLELEGLHADGHEVPVELTISALRTPDGWAFHAFLHDISARRAGEEQARLLACIVKGSGDPIIGTDCDGVLVSWNPAAEQVFGHREDEALGRPATLLMLPGGEDEFAATARIVSTEGRPVRTDVRRRHKDGHAVDVALTVSPLHDASGSVVGQSVVARDISERRREEERLARYTGELKARTSEDPQTGLPAQRELDAAIDRCIADAVPFTLLLLGADGMRERNETKGYAAGDRTLRGLAAAATANVREADTVFRYAGAALAVLMPAIPVGGAGDAGRRIQEALARAEPDLQIVAGTASWPVTARERDGLIRAARGGVEAERAARASASAESRSGLSASAVAAVDRLLDTAAAHLGLDVAWLSELTGEELVFRGLGGDAASFGLEHDTVLPFGGTICARVMDGRLPPAIADTASHPASRELATTRAGGIGAYVGAPVRLRDGAIYGLVCAAAHEARPDLDAADAKALALLATLVAERLDEERLAAEEHRLDVEDTGVSALLAALDARDQYTADHSQAVVRLSGAVARALALPADAVAEVEQVALVHDVGKVGIPDAVLQKQAPLTELEWELMRQHSALGARIVASIGSLAHLADAVRAEHERWDGGGYPDGLRGHDIPIASRIILASDAFHAMTSDRPYRQALDHATAVAELEACAGTQFDPAVVAALTRVLEPRASRGA